jgi:hypothetical protein
MLPWPVPERLTYADEELLAELDEWGHANNNTYRLRDLTHTEAAARNWVGCLRKLNDPELDNAERGGDKIVQAKQFQTYYDKLQGLGFAKEATLVKAEMDKFLAKLTPEEAEAARLRA